MASGPVPVGGFDGNGINLANYFPHQRSFNTVVYLHKRFLDPPKKDKNNEANSKIRIVEKKKKDKHDKGQQFNGNKADIVKGNKSHNIGINNDSVVEQTIRFAKDIAPLVIPGREQSPPVYYTVKTSKKTNKKAKTPQDSSNGRQDTYKKGKSKKIFETYRKEFKSNSESFSIKESISHSENDTLDDLNINQSLSCSFSEVSERKCQRKGNHRDRNNERNVQKLAVSESFEALATEMNASGDTKIKIHLMNDQDKYLLSESIRVPIMNAIKECLLELNSSNINSDVKTAQRSIKYSAQKLDNILDRLTCIEKKLDDHAKVKSPGIPTLNKSSTLEQLGQDLVEVHETSEEEEEISHTLNEKRSNKRSVECIKTSARGVETRIEDGCGEVAGRNTSFSKDFRSDCPNRIPARFCWTDGDRKK